MRKGWLLPGMIAALCAACAKPAPQAPAAEHAAMDPALSLLAQAVATHRLALLGELHGTRETPALAGDLVAHYAKRGPVILALEIDHGQQPVLARYLASDGGADARAQMLAGSHWRDAMHDGRDSAAMFQLVERVRVLRKGGAPVGVLAFDPSLRDMDARNAGMARILRRAAALAPRARLVVLTGNVHAMTHPQEMFLDGRRITLVTAGRALADLAPVSIDIRGASGEFWACRQSCAKQPVASPRTLPAPSLERNAPGSGWDYTLVLPRLTASPPAIAAIDTATAAR
jgi:erythromycin esterase-like protein